MSYAKKKKDGNVYSVYSITIRGQEGKAYFGMTCNLESRFRSHLRYLVETPQTMSSKRTLLYKAAREAGVTDKDVQFYIIKEGMTWDEADQLETELIRKYKTYMPEHGWNVAKAEVRCVSSEAIHGMPPIEAPD